MLHNAPFYHQLTRKAVVLFGRMFDDITIVRKSTTTGKEVNRFRVPIVYSPKEKMITRITSDPDLLRQIQTILPRMGFEITAITYDATRKQNSLLKTSKANTQTHVSSTYMGVPYDLTFHLNIYTRNIDDGTHIVEQILPFFNPDFTVSTNMIPDLGFLKDIPVILTGVTNNIEYEGDQDSVRYVNWTLTFTMKLYYYGPISYPKIIRQVEANIWDDSSFATGNLVRINTSDVPANSHFKLNDTVYQGKSPKTATAYGVVVGYNANTGILNLTSVQGRLDTNSRIHAVSTNAYANIVSFITGPYKAASIVIDPDPINAQPTDDYGYNITITESPD